MGKSGSSLISGILRRYGLVAALLFVAFAALSAVLSLKTPPEYYSRATAYVTQSPEKAAGGLSSLGGGDSMLDEMALLESARVKKYVADKLFLTVMPEPDWQPSPLLYQFHRAFAVLRLAHTPLDYGQLDYPAVTAVRMDFSKAQNNVYVVTLDGSGSYSLLVNGRAVDTKPVGETLSSPALDFAANGFTTGRAQRWKLSLTDPSQIVQEMSLRLRVFRIGDKSRTIGVGSTQTHPQLAARLAREMMQWYIDHDVETRQAASREALVYIDQQIASVEEGIEGLRAEMRKLLDDRSRLIASQQSGAVTQSFLSEGVQLNDLQTELAQVEALTAQWRKNKDKRGYYRSVEVPGIIETDLISKIIDTEQFIDNELQLKTEEHPDVVRLRQQLASQEQALGEFLDESASQLRRKIANAGQNVGKFQALLDLTPESSMELNRLTGEIELQNAGLAALLQQKLEASLRKISDVSTVNPVDEAVANPRPVRPRLGQVAFSACIFALIATVAAVLLLRASDPRVAGPDDLASAYGLPVLATLRSNGQDASELEQRRLAARTARILQQLEGPLGILIAHGKPTSATVADTMRKSLSGTTAAGGGAAERIRSVDGTGVTAVYNAQLNGIGKLVVVSTPGGRRIRELSVLKEEATAAGLDVTAFLLLER